MARYKKQDLEAIKEELEEKELLEELLEQLSKHKRGHLAKGNNKKSKDRGGNDGKKNTQRIASPDQSNRALAKEEIIEIIDSHHIGSPHLTIPDQPKLSPEQKLIINWDFEGVNISKEENCISTYFKNALATAQKYDISNRHEYSDYELTNIPIWSEMAKFKNFQAMYFPICHQLSNIGYSPNELQYLNIYDVAYLIKKHNKENPQKMMQCQRTKYLKMFEVCYGEDFSRIESMLGREEDAKNFLEYIHQIGTSKQYSDETWEKLQKSAALYNVHHKKNRQFANETDDYSKINDFSNLTLCYANPYHTIMHHPQELDLNTNLVYLGGLRKEFRIVRNPANERLYSQGIYKIKSGGRSE